MRFLLGRASIVFSKVKQKPRVLEKHDSFFRRCVGRRSGNRRRHWCGRFGHSFGNRVKLLRITPEPKPISVVIAALKGRLSPAAEKFWQCAKDAVSVK
jgi:hypothetical protein